MNHTSINLLNELHQKATPGNWIAHLDRWADEGYTDSWSIRSDKTLEWSREIDANNNQVPYVTDICTFPAEYKDEHGRHYHDAQFVAAVHQYLPELLNYITQLEKRLCY